MKGINPNEEIDFSKFIHKPTFVDQPFKKKIQNEKKQENYLINSRKASQESYTVQSSKESCIKIQFEDISCNDRKSNPNCNSRAITRQSSPEGKNSVFLKRPNSVVVVRGGEFVKNCVTKKKENDQQQKGSENSVKNRLNELKRQWKNEGSSKDLWNRKANLCFDIMKSLMKQLIQNINSLLLIFINRVDFGFSPLCIEALSEENDVWKILFSTLHHLIFCYDQEVISLIEAPYHMNSQTIHPSNKKLNSLEWCENGLTQSKQNNLLKEEGRNKKQSSPMLKSEKQRNRTENSIYGGFEQDHFIFKTEPRRSSNDYPAPQISESISPVSKEKPILNRFVKTNKEILCSIVDMVKQKEISDLEAAQAKIKNEQEINSLKIQIDSIKNELNYEKHQNKIYSQQLEQKSRNDSKYNLNKVNSQIQEEDTSGFRKEISYLEIQLAEAREERAYLKQKASLSPKKSNLSSTEYKQRYQSQQNNIHSSKVKKKRSSLSNAKEYISTSNQTQLIKEENEVPFEEWFKQNLPPGNDLLPVKKRRYANEKVKTENTNQADKILNINDSLFESAVQSIYQVNTQQHFYKYTDQIKTKKKQSNQRYSSVDNGSYLQLQQSLNENPTSFSDQKPSFPQYQSPSQALTESTCGQGKVGNNQKIILKRNLEQIQSQISVQSNVPQQPNLKNQSFSKDAKKAREQFLQFVRQSGKQN